MDKTYQPHAIESRWYKEWESRHYFAPQGSGEPYTIMIPPPNVTGSLHMGHGFNNAIMDALIRWRRMQGRNTLWQPGTDHAGIATQMVVERQLQAQNISRHDLGREQFLERVWAWKEQSGGTITRQIRRLGSSVDWSRERFTMDEGLSEAVREAFVRLHDDGLIYRGKRLVNWDTRLHTAISDLEVENHDEKGHLWHLRYPLANGATTSEGLDYLVVATTRPETMLGDAEVAVHPEDERYRQLIGQSVCLPLVNRLIPVIADEYVDREFGTGCVKITPAHDFNDYDVGKRHDLPLINIFDRDAAILASAQVFRMDGQPGELAGGTGLPAEFSGLDRFEARKRIVAAFEATGLLEKIDDHALKVPRGDRSGTIIEPWLTDQWYVATRPLADKAMAAVESGAIQFIPKQYENMYFAWMRDIQDWCISRQLWWGHRIPAWYDAAGKVYVGRNEAEVRERYALGDQPLQQDEDVLDTWFSSGLWTFSTLGWPQPTEFLKTFHPTDVLVTGFDIIFFWVARMIMLSLHLTGQVPFRTVYVHGLVRDAQGQKMSKSKGNVLDPLDIVDGIELEALVAKRTSGMMQPKMAERIARQTREEFPGGIASYGTDALRFTFCSLASTGRDIKFDMGRVEGYRNFCNKLWNAASFVLENTDGRDCGVHQEPVELSSVDRWIISLLQRTEMEMTRQLEAFRFDLAAQALYEFIWDEYCAWYLELVKPVLWDENAPAGRQRGTRRTLVRVLEAALRLAHPFMPFITEEIWQRIKVQAGKQGPTLMLQPWPVADEQQISRAAEQDIEWIKALMLGIRQIRAEMNISMARRIDIILARTCPEDERRLQDNLPLLAKLAKLETVRLLPEGEEPPLSATALVGEMQVLVPMAGLIDKEAELARLDKEIQRLDTEVRRVAGKLANQGFVAKAPAAVIDKERARLAEAEQALLQLAGQREKIAGL